MKLQKLLSTICLFLAFSSLANAQTSKDEMIKEWERAKTYTKEYLDAMPESGYALKPTPEIRSFAEQMLHLTDGNYGFAAAASGEKVLLPQENWKKQQINPRQMSLKLYWMDMIL
jgi:uncharacterized damage-inducible protein DinB